jgi:hypothetical protein
MVEQVVETVDGHQAWFEPKRARIEAVLAGGLLDRLKGSIVRKAPLSPESLSEGFLLLEANGLVVDMVLLNPHRFHELRVHAPSWLDLETQEVCLREGVVGSFWGATLVRDVRVPSRTVVIMGRDPKDWEAPVSLENLGLLEIDHGR